VDNTRFIIITLFFLNTIIGGLLTYLHLRSKPPEKKKQLWIKYFFFFLINSSVICLLQLTHFWFNFTFVIILLLGLYEIVNNGIKHLKILFVGLIIYAIISLLFVNFIISTSTFGILIVYCFAITFDGFSQVAGQLFGKFKFVARASPNKTFEGLLGGLLLVFINYFIIFKGQTNASSLFTTVIIVISYQLGDLLFSVYKRKVLIKDYSKIIPGHGGVLDRFDSFLIAGCMAYLLKLLNYEI
jgi:phosphatidate cytidylyltransferase